MAGATGTSNGEAVADKRSAERFTLVLRVGKLVCAAGEFLCVLRDVSTDGFKARLFHPLPAAPEYHLELGGGECFRIEPAWEAEHEVGFRFLDGPVDVHGLLAETGPFPKRHIRLRLKNPLPVRIQGDGLERVALLSDISQHGVLAEIEPRLALGQRVLVDVPGVPPLHARVRWRRGKACGLVFQEGFRVDALALLAARLQLGTGKAPPAALRA